jgi:hypothetical protein
MADGSGRSLLDDEGRLFGLVNVIDVLVVLLFLAVVVAGVTLLLPGGGEADTRYATIDLGEQPEYVAERISPGDEWDPDGTAHSLTITDVYRFDVDGSTNVTIRAEINGTRIEPADAGDAPTLEFRGDRLRLGRTLGIDTGEYSADGQVTRVDQSGRDLPIQKSTFVVETQVSSGTIDEIAVGDQFRVAGDTFAEITDFEAYPNGNSTRYALLAITARTINRSGTLRFGDRPVRVGSTVPFETGEYELEGAIVSRGSSTIETEQRPLVLQTTVPTSVAADVQPGDEFRIGDTPVVTVEEVTVYATGNANRRRIVLGVNALTRSEDGSLLFGDRQVRIGSSIPLETGEYDIDGEVIRRDGLTEPGTPTVRTARLQLTNIPPERAEVITEGMTERVRGTETARIVEKTDEPAEVVLESDDGDIFLREHPRNRDVELVAELHVRELDDGSIRFRGETLLAGQTIRLELGSTTIEAELIAFTDG